MYGREYFVHVTKRKRMWKGLKMCVCKLQLGVAGGHARREWGLAGGGEGLTERGGERGV